MNFTHLVPWDKLKNDADFRWDKYKSIVVVIATNVELAQRLEGMSKDITAATSALCVFLTWAELRTADHASSPLAGMVAAARTLDPVARSEHSFAIWVSMSSIIEYAKSGKTADLVGHYFDVTGGDDAYLRRQIATCVADAEARQGTEPKLLELVVMVVKLALAIAGVAKRSLQI